MPETFSAEVPVEFLPKVKDRVKRAQARARRLGVPVPSMTSGQTHLMPDPRWAGHPEDAPAIEAIEVTLIAPEHLGLPGYSLLGRVDTLPDGTPLVARTPGTEETAIPPIESAGYCDHCRKVRRRNETFLVLGPDGIRQVGRQCLRDFLGSSPEALLWWFSWLREQREAFGEYLGQAEDYWPKSLILRLASRVAAHGGYMSARKRQELDDARWSEGSEPYGPPPPPTTKAIIDDWDRLLRGASKGALGRKSREELAELEARYPDDEGAQRLLDATEAALADLDPNRSEWHSNLGLVMSQQYVRPRHLGIAVSAVVLGLQALEPKEPKEPKPEVVSVPLGAVGERLRALPVEVTFVRHFDGEWGTRTLMKFRSEERQADLMWWASGYIPEDIVGQQRAITGTVKAHEQDRFTKRPVTVLTRAKVEEA